MTVCCVLSVQLVMDVHTCAELPLLLQNQFCVCFVPGEYVCVCVCVCVCLVVGVVLREEVEVFTEGTGEL